jgi:hypothetical protein
MQKYRCKFQASDPRQYLLLELIIFNAIVFERELYGHVVIHGQNSDCVALNWDRILGPLKEDSLNMTSHWREILVLGSDKATIICRYELDDQARHITRFARQKRRMFPRIASWSVTQGWAPKSEKPDAAPSDKRIQLPPLPLTGSPLPFRSCDHPETRAQTMHALSIESLLSGRSPVE